MYFWRIEKLKAELATRPLSERQALPYLVVYSGLCAAAGYVPPMGFNLWDRLLAVWGVTLAVVGTIYVYRQNGGAGGQHFLQRYFAIGQVVAIRWLVMMGVPMVALYATLGILGRKPEETTWLDFVSFGALGAVLYWRIGYHVRDLASRTTRAV